MQQVIMNICLFCMVIVINWDNSLSIIHVKVLEKKKTIILYYLHKDCFLFFDYINFEFN